MGCVSRELRGQSKGLQNIDSFHSAARSKEAQPALMRDNQLAPTLGPTWARLVPGGKLYPPLLFASSAIWKNMSSTP
ncbi:hypothetical protein EMPG_16175 [Blastomyces silverae]|uniref:Uncharacterized protein n=1 Tax=Blastomyces silverae TaxID=2060906 RepID=A0A0H1BAM0_9EURO|nr:hypothetical protein EMPG_16175 [Blastomyces silverae]